MRSNHNPEAAKKLLPEIAAALHMSVSSLERKPPDVQVWLASVYVLCCFSDDLTIREALQQQIFLNHETVTEMQQLTKEKEPDVPQINQQEKLPDETAEPEEKQVKMEMPYISRDAMKRTAQRLREEHSSSGTHQKVEERTEEIEREMRKS